MKRGDSFWSRTESGGLSESLPPAVGHLQGSRFFLWIVMIIIQCNRWVCYSSSSDSWNKSKMSLTLVGAVVCGVRVLRRLFPNGCSGPVGHTRPPRAPNSPSRQRRKEVDTLVSTSPYHSSLLRPRITSSHSTAGGVTSQCFCYFATPLMLAFPC